MNHHSTWLEQRRKIVGASDIPALLGLSPHKSAVDVWLGKVQPLVEIETEYTRAGKKMEPVILEMYAEDSGLAVTPNRDLVLHPSLSFVGCTPDGYVEESGLIEAKNTSRWVDEVRPDHYVQLQYQLGVTGRKWGAVVYLVQGYRLQSYRSVRNDALIATLNEVAAEFWENHVLTGIAPEPEAIFGDAAKLFPAHVQGKSIEATKEILATIQRYKSLASADKVGRADKEMAAEAIRSVMGDAEALTYEGAVLATWKKSADGLEFDEKRFKSDHPDLWKEYMVTRPGARRLLVK
jgi:putative phage-type endonuclease